VGAFALANLTSLQHLEEPMGLAQKSYELALFIIV
jgi:hypothetical protein